MMKIKVTEIFHLSSKIIFNVTVQGDKYLIGDIFANEANDLKFVLKGIAMENQPQSNSKSLQVEPTGEYISIEGFKNKIFYRE